METKCIERALKLLDNSVLAITNTEEIQKAKIVEEARDELKRVRDELTRKQNTIDFLRAEVDERGM